jgi:hypothetical protein
MATPKQNFIQRISGAKKKAEGNLEAFGARIRKNIDQGQVDLKSGKIGRYDYINPFK